MKDFKVRMKYDMKDFEEKAKKLMDDINLEAQDIVKKSAIVFANAAAKWTPPRKGGSPSLTIPKEKYERPFVVLSALIAEQYPGLTATDIDKAQFKKRNEVQDLQHKKE